MIQENPDLINYTNQKLKNIFAKRKFLILEQKFQIVEMRFGCYGKILQPLKSYSKIARDVGAKVSTVISVVRTYKKREGKLLCKLNNNAGRKQLVNIEIQQEICRVDLLQKWANLSLSKRCDLIFQQYQIKISRFTLSNIYKQNQIKYLKTHKSFHSDTREEQLTQQRLQFISQIARFINDGYEIVYMDETSTNVWESQYKIWQPTNTILPMVYKLPKHRGVNMTIIGAITNKKNKIYYNITNKTCTLTVMDFFRYLKRQFNFENKIFVMDNHKSHHSKIVLNFVENHGGIVLFMPPISSYFNPIETIWSWVKSKWRNELIQLNGKQPSARFMSQTLKKLCENAPPLIVTNIANSVIPFMKKYFEEFSQKQNGHLQVL